MPKKYRLASKYETIAPILGEETTETWMYPPTVSRSSGKSRFPYDEKLFIRIRSAMFPVPVIMMSDLHQHSFKAVKKLAKKVDLSRYLILSVGDMAGEGYFGSDGDPTPTYKFLAEQAGSFYFVQGNHDLPAEDNSHLDLTNNDGSKCMLQNRDVISTPIGKIGGINGTISRKPHPYKLPPSDFYSELARMFHENKDIDIVMTHETPQLPITKRYIGKERLYDMVQMYNPKIHLYGHCHHPTPINVLDHVTFINADGKILVFDPVE